MDQRERLIWDLIANVTDAERGLTRLGKTADTTAGFTKKLQDKLDELSKTSAEARIGLKGDKEALAQLDKLDLRLARLAGRKIDPEVNLEGVARAGIEMAALDAGFDKLKNKAEDAAGASGKGGLSALAGAGGAAGGGMGGLIAAGAALSPVLITLGTGLGGLAVAAFGMTKNSKLLKQELAPLRTQVAGFQSDLRPVVLADFNAGLHLAGGLLHDIEPVTKATGLAFAGFLGQVNRMFHSPEWQGLFSFMARTAQPDMALLGKTFVDTANTLPPLIEGLQPLARALLVTADDAAKATLAIERFFHGLSAEEQRAATRPRNPLEAIWGAVVRTADNARSSVADLGKILHLTTPINDQAAKSTRGYAAAESLAAIHAQSLALQVKALTADMTKNDATILTLQGDTITWQQSLQAATQQLNSNKAGLSGNSKAALANKAAVLQSTQQAQQLAEQELHTRDGVSKASDVIRQQIRWLQQHGDKSKFAAAEIKVLREELDRIHSIQAKIAVTGRGSWTVTSATDVGSAKSGLAGALAGRAAGWRVPGYGGGDRWPALLEGGETVVPKYLTPAVAPLMKAHGVPGFAQGGVAGSYAGSVPGLTGFLGREAQATVSAIAASVAGAIHSAITSAISGFGATPGGGAPAANAALARRMYPPWGSGAEWAAWNAVAMRESGWNQYARNPSSGAYGIPQALPPGKMGPAANPPQSNPGAQIAWMISYIKSVYGDPVRAWAHELSAGWYDQGGYLPVGASIAVNTTGRPEPVGAAATPGGQGLKIVLEVKTGPGANALDQAIVDVIQKYVNVAGGGDVDVAFGRRF